MKKINLVKIGSDSIVDTEKKELKKSVLQNIINDIIYLRENFSEDFLMLSSGAVAKGNSLIDDSSNFLKSTIASIGQSRLVSMYDKLMGKSRLVGQILFHDCYNQNLFEKVAKDNNLIFNEDAIKTLRPC